MRRAAFVLWLLILAGLAPAQDDARIRALLQKLDDDSIALRASTTI